MGRAKLTVRTVEAVPPSDKDVIVWDTVVPAFGLKVTPRGKRTFFLFYRTADHTQRKPKIGEYPAMKPENARRIASDWLADVRRGGDPSGMRRASRQTRGQNTIAEMFDAYVAFKRRQRRKSIGQIQRVFAHDILPVLGPRRAENVTPQDVTKMLDAIEIRSVASALAARRQLSAFYSWAMPRLGAGAVNPVKNASRPAALPARDRALSNSELAALWRVLDGERDPWRTAIRLLILTGQRLDEVLSAEWSEFDLPARTWTIPGARTKNSKTHVVPLSGQAVALLEGLPTKSGRLFPKGTGPVGRAAKRIREKMPSVPHWQLHDIRRTVATGLQRLGERLEVTEAILNHVSGSRGGIVGVYQRHDWADEKRLALDKWASEVTRITA